MELKTNQELSDFLAERVEDSGIKKKWIGEKIGKHPNHVNDLIKKKNLSVDEANKILNLLGYNAKIIIEEI